MTSGGDTESHTAKHLSRPIVAAFAAALVLRVLLVVVNIHAAPERAFENDSLGYLQPAEALAHEGRYTVDATSDRAEVLRTPGYPVFLASLLLVGEDLRWVMGAQAAITGAVILGATFLLARRLALGRRAAAVAAVVATVEPFQVATSGLLMSESLATTAATLATLTLVSMWQQPSAGRVALASSSSVVLLFIRPSFLFVPALVAVVAFVAVLKSSKKQRRAFGASALALAIAAVPIGVWSARNHGAIDRWTFTTVDSVTIYWYRAGGLIAEREGRDWYYDVRTDLTLSLNPGMSREDADRYRAGQLPPSQAHDEGAYYDAARSEGIRILRSDPSGTLEQAARGVYSQTVSSGWVSTAETFGVEPPPGFAAAGAVINLGFIGLGVAGLIRAVRLRSRFGSHVIVASIAIYTLAINAGYQAIDGHRFRATLVPLVAIYAVSALSAILVKARSRTVRAPEGST